MKWSKKYSAILLNISMLRSYPDAHEVLEGLKEGEEVIVYPGSRVREGQRVKPITL